MKKRNSHVTPARRIAWDVLWHIHEQGCYMAEALEEVGIPADLPAEEGAFARLLVTEVVARQGALDRLIDEVLRNPDDVQDNVRVCLRLSFCELFYLKKASHAVVDQGVELVRYVAPKASGLANFALRRAVERKDSFPFGDVSTDHKAAALCYGFPQWLEQRLLQEYGSVATLRFMQRANDPAPLFFMINAARVEGARTLKLLVDAGCKVAPCAVQRKGSSFPTFVFLQRTAVAHPLVVRLLEEGALVISDQAAQVIAQQALPAEEPRAMLEIGAGRGTKSILIQNAALARYGYQITLDTLDVSERRSLERERRLRRAQIKQRSAFVQDATDLSSMNALSYDVVFIDAPCSGVGTLRRHPDIRWRVTPDDITALAHTGVGMLTEAARLVKAGGRLVYATCTVFGEENEEVIKAFLSCEAGKDFGIMPLSIEGMPEFASTHGTLLPGTLSSQEKGPYSDTHFVCVMQRL